MRSLVGGRLFKIDHLDRPVPCTSESDIATLGTMPNRRFAPPWSIEDIGTAYVVKDGGGQKLAYIHYEDEPGRRSTTKMLTKDETRRLRRILPGCRSYIYVRSHPGFGCARIRLNRNAAGALPPKKLRELLCFSSRVLSALFSSSHRSLLLIGAIRTSNFR
jgi:hypothetical protein